MGFFSLVALILIAAKAFGFLTLSWAWCFAPILVDVALGALCLGAGFFGVRTAKNILASNWQTEEIEKWHRAKDKLG